MPFVTRLSIQDFRNIGSASVEPSSGINVFFGENGAGKTSLLESISVLAHGKSFRTHKTKNTIRIDQSKFTLFTRVTNDEGTEEPIGVERDKQGKQQIRVNGDNINSSAMLANRMPLIVVNADSFRLLEGSPKERRKFFDWLVFHVKHDFARLWKQYSRCIKQRNSLLRRGKISYSDLLPWDREIASLSDEIQRCRLDSFEKFNTAFISRLKQLSDFEGSDIEDRSFVQGISLEYIDGWKGDELSYADQLAQSFDRDLRYGYTTIGPHKADIKIKKDSLLASEVLSRGQQKITVTALLMSEAQVFSELRGANPIFAVDDMPAELDVRHQRLLGKWLHDTGAQVFATGVESGFASIAWPDVNDIKVFHVKHGTITTNN